MTDRPRFDWYRAAGQLGAQAVDLLAEVQRLRRAMAWVGEVRPGMTDAGGAVVHITWDEFNTMRAALGLPAQKPARKGRAGR